MLSPSLPVKLHQKKKLMKSAAVEEVEEIIRENAQDARLRNEIP